MTPSTLRAPRTPYDRHVTSSTLAAHRAAELRDAQRRSQDGGSGSQDGDSGGRGGSSGRGSGSGSRRKSYRHFCTRLGIGSLLWVAGATWALLGVLLSWDWMAALTTDLRFPDQVWGDALSRPLHDLGLGLLVALSAIFAICWSVTKDRANARYNAAAKAGTVLRWLVIALSVTLLVMVAISATTSVRYWWLIFPGEIGAGGALLCILAGAAILPSLTAVERRGIIDIPRASRVGSAMFVVGLLVAAQLSPNIFNATQVTHKVGSVVSQVNVTADTWTTTWRGAHNPVTIYSYTPQTTALTMSQATRSRDLLALLDSRTGEIISAMSAQDALATGLDALLYSRTSDAEHRLFDQTLVFFNQIPVTISREGERLTARSDVPGSTWDAANSTLSRGLLGVDLVTGEDWLVGSSGGCTRIPATSDDGEWIASADAIVMLQVCNAELSGQNWSAPSGLEHTIAPLAGTVFAISPEDGTTLWHAGLPNWDDYIASTGMLFPQTRTAELDIAFDITQTTSDAPASVHTHPQNVENARVTVAGSALEFSPSEGP